MPPAADADAKPIAWQHDGFQPAGLAAAAAPHGAAGRRAADDRTIVHGGPGAAQTPYFLGAGLIRDMLDRRLCRCSCPTRAAASARAQAFTHRDRAQHGPRRSCRTFSPASMPPNTPRPIDDHRLGIGGWSYGGYMAMFAGTQTDRFRAAYAGAGISDWQSYYGQTGIDGWMLPFFGASVYDDPGDLCNSSSPMTYIKQARVPTFLAVGQRRHRMPAGADHRDCGMRCAIIERAHQRRHLCRGRPQFPRRRPYRRREPAHRRLVRYAYLAP